LGLLDFSFMSIQVGEMKRCLFIFLLLGVTATHAGSEWSQWRGAYDGDGIIKGDPLITHWSETENVVWKTPVPGRGASSPILAGNRVYLTTADDQAGQQFVLCYDRATGKELWRQLAFEGEFLYPTHRQNTEATPTPVTDGEIVVAMFGINQGKFLVAYDLDGNRLWTTKVAFIDSRFGIGASPVLFKDKIIVLNDMRPTTFVAAYDIQSGKQIWKTERKGDPNDYNENHNYQTPRVFHVEGRDQLVITGFGDFTSYDPDTGSLLWSIEGGARVSVGAPVARKHLVYFSGGYPEQKTYAFNMKTRSLEWSNRIWTYIVSNVVVGDYLYGSTNRGELVCMDADTGEILWRQPFKEDALASPFLAGGYLYFILGNGVSKVIKPDPSEYIEVAENSIPGKTFAVPAVADGRMYYRSEDALYCLGERKLP
jgi:outer membrane protein assembly factor BamB